MHRSRLPNGNVLEQFEATPEFGNDKLGKADLSRRFT
jgi:hypothetical protein